MALTLAPEPPKQPKGTPVRLAAQRPTDPLIEGFEGVFDGLCALLDDLTALQQAHQLQREMRQIIVTLERQLLAGVKPSHLERRLRQLQLLDARNMNHVSARIERLRMTAMPEARRIANNLDLQIIKRDEFAASHKPCGHCKGTGFVL